MSSPHIDLRASAESKAAVEQQVRLVALNMVNDLAKQNPGAQTHAQIIRAANDYTNFILKGELALEVALAEHSYTGA